MARVISVNNLDIIFRVGSREIRAVQGVSFAVAPGESFGIVGESGSGKSTVLRAIAGLVPPSDGTIEVNGRPAGSRRRSDRRLLQYVFQDPYGSLHPRKTVDDTLREPLEIHREGDIDAKVSQAIADVGLQPMQRFRYPHQLSGGQRQRVAIARALMLKPPILLLDEPTSALDVSIQAEILNLLGRLGRSYSLTSILVSHDLAVVAHLCSRIAIMQLGRVVEVISAEDLRAGKMKVEYTRNLVQASRGFTRAGA
ncbi:MULTISPECIES: ABC transporter ATP-binding protein [unclassified Devosia]|uniref:ABC transporter ATP-binding protein n=1 Tax=unclassified Devosia TaxID=196773 RepID=UPI0032BF2530